MNFLTGKGGAYSFSRVVHKQLKGEALDGLEGEVSSEISRTDQRAASGANVPYEVFLSAGECKFTERSLRALTARSNATADGDSMARLQSVRENRALAVGAGYGSETVATEIGDLVELWRDRPVSIELGATVLSGLSGNVQLPLHTGTAAGVWDAETDTLSETSQTLSTTTLSPKRAGVTSTYSKQLLVQSTMDVADFVLRDHRAMLGVKLDQAALEGSGASDQPLGIVNFPDANSITFGGAMTYAKLVSAWTQCMDASPDQRAMSTFAFVMTPEALQSGLTIPRVASTDSQMILREESVSPASAFSFLGQPVVGRTGITGDKLIAGCFSELVIGMFGSGVDVIVDPYSGAKSAQISITSNLLCDVACRHQDSWCVSADSASQ